MHPVLLETSFFTIHSYGFMISLAILVCSILLLRQAPKAGYNPDHVLEAIIALGISGLIGARVLYVLQNWNYYAGDLYGIINLRIGGLSFYGALAFGIIALLLWGRWRKVTFLKTADFFAPYLLLGYAFGRVGCFLNGCCFGRPTDLFIGLPAAFTDNLLRHPVQLYASAAALLFFFLAIYLRKFSFFNGYNLTLLLLFYGILRGVTGFFRQDPIVWLELSLAQLVSFALVILMAVIFLIKKRNAVLQEATAGNNE